MRISTLDDIAPLLQQARSCFVPNPGNAGDALIALGTFHYFDSQKIPFPPVVSVEEKEAIRQYDLVIYSGGGNLIPHYGDALDVLRYASEYRKKIIVLPHTTFGYESELTRMASSLHLFCRDKVSFDMLLTRGMPDRSITLSEDMAFKIDRSFLEKYDRKPHLRTAYCMRTDVESRNRSAALFSENCDISFLWNGNLWGDRVFVERVVASLITYICQFESVVTDRLHIGILAALLDRQVQLFPNSYYKNKAVYEFSMRNRLPNVTFCS